MIIIIPQHTQGLKEENNSEPEKVVQEKMCTILCILNMNLKQPLEI